MALQKEIPEKAVMGPFFFLRNTEKSFLAGID
jgi:hypothetical protein